MSNRASLSTLAMLATAFAGAACSSPPASGDAAAPGTAPSPSASAAAPAARVMARVREGGALASTVAGDALLVADEDHQAVRVVRLPLGASSEVKSVRLPGAPAQVLALADRVLVTVRASSTLAEKTEDGGAPRAPDAPKGPGFLLVMKPDAAAGLAEVARVSLPADAWGIAVTPDEKTALVSSAWTHKVTGVDLASAAVKWTVDVAREPRGIVVRPDGAAYVTHLVGADLTRIDDLGGTPRVSKVELPPSPARSASGKKLNASLSYSAVLSAEGDKLFVARHALGALGRFGWFGAATVDVLVTKDDKPFSAVHKGAPTFAQGDSVTGMPSAVSVQVSGNHQFFWSAADVPYQDSSLFAQPRALAYRKSTRTVLVASEGTDALVELDAEALDPSLSVVQVFLLGGKHDPYLKTAGECGAPSGLALSADERTAWVYCRATDDVVSVALDAFMEPQREVRRPQPTPHTSPARTALVHLADDPLPDKAAAGRRLFYNATNTTMSDGLACAGCHPEGRDDGHVWHEVHIRAFYESDRDTDNLMGSAENVPIMESKGVPRRTPMLAGKVWAPGPYGWRGESANLRERIKRGFKLHRWKEGWGEQSVLAVVESLAQFLPLGLVLPPSEDHEPTEQEKRGKEIFTSETARCAKCHVAETGYTDRVVYPFAKLPQIPGFDDEEGPGFKTPSLRHVGGRAPYYHDGRAPTLEALIEKNADRMGKTSHLSADDRAALIAYLRTL